MIGIVCLYVSMLYLIIHQLEIAFALTGVTLISVIVLYFSWYKTLPPPSKPVSEEQENLEELLDGVETAEEAAWLA